MTTVYKDFDLPNPKEVQLLNDIENIDNYKQQILSLNSLINENKIPQEELIKLKEGITKMENVFNDLKSLIEKDDINPNYVEPFKIISDFLSERLSK